jgi:hypothetical protein
VPHLKTIHPALWEKWIDSFITLRAEGYPLKRIMRLFKAGDGNLLFSWTVIERAIRRRIEIGNSTYSPPRKPIIRYWNPENFKLEATTVWDFPRRGE